LNGVFCIGILFVCELSQYARVDVDTKMTNMLQLMMKVWGLEKPNLLISVTGGAKNFQMNKRLKDTFRRGLMKTALTTGKLLSFNPLYL